MQRGDHLVTARTGYEHHGLYLGQGRVIHYTPDGVLLASLGNPPVFNGSQK
ncbi:lecithin retinol acyltransferase family protein [Laribacter hongkongensis]|uniref:lecithin retinol acyltransferase family protein n=1 Tax=Laribacter hongkongensis TaxID=168471 RepID=UPI002816AE2D|nr:lecithin retinol acyltransferase family protein [Laribacter hongkongensis]